MTTEEFCYWLKGYFELREGNVGLGTKQCNIIKDHLDLVFNKVTPKRDLTSEEIENALRNIKDEIFDEKADAMNDLYDKQKTICCAEESGDKNDYRQVVYQGPSSVKKYC